MKVRPMLLLVAAMAQDTVADNESLRGSSKQQQLDDDTTEHEDDPYNITEHIVEEATHSSNHATVQVKKPVELIGNDVDSLLNALLVDTASHRQQRERKLEQLKQKKKQEKEQRRKTAKRNAQIKREINDDHDPDEFQFEIDDFAASVESAQFRFEQKKKRQELKMQK
jgi:phosphatidate phosphatase PAH1